MGFAASAGARKLRAFWLRCIRIHRGLTQAQLAELVGVSANQISRYERSHDDPSLDILDRLLRALECWYGDIVADPTIPPPPRRAMHRPTADVVERSIDIVLAEFAHPTRPPDLYPKRMRCWICHGRPGECHCYQPCKVCGLPVQHGHRCSGKLHSTRAAVFDKAC